MALGPARSIEAFCHNDGGRPRSDSSLSFPMASNHLRFAAPLSLHEEGKELWSSAVNTHALLHVNIQITPPHVHLASTHTPTALRTSHKPLLPHCGGSLRLICCHRMKKQPAVQTACHSYCHYSTLTHAQAHPLTCHQHFIDMRKSFIVRGQKQRSLNLPPSSERKRFKDLSFLLWGGELYQRKEWQRRTCWSTLRRTNPPLDPHTAINHQISVMVQHSKGYFGLWFIFVAHLPPISLFSLF